MILPTLVEPVKLMRLTAGVRDQRLDDLGRILGIVGDHVDRAVRQSCLGDGLADQAVRAGAHFRRLQHNSIAAGERHGDGARAENDRRVPRSNADADAGRLADSHRQRARLVGRDDLA